jgi:CubicO group peptidase (beta-lactamase class C family)
VTNTTNTNISSINTSALDRRTFLRTTGTSAALVASATGVAHSREAAPSRPSSSDDTRQGEQAMSSGGLSKARLSRLHDVMAGYVERGESPGIVSLVSRRGEVHVDAVGMQAILAFGQMMLNKGKHGSERILSRPSVEAMTTDQLTSEQKAVSGLIPGYFDSHGWGFGVAIVTRRDDMAGAIGRFGWDGGLGTSWYSDPREDMVTILLTQCAWTSPNPSNVFRDFWTSAYQAIDD